MYKKLSCILANMSPDHPGRTVVIERLEMFRSLESSATRNMFAGAA